MLSQKRADACIQYLISKGIASDRLVSSGKGESEPYILTEEDSKREVKGGFLTKKVFKEGDEMSVSYINGLKNKFKETAHQLNRRTSFKVLSENYIPNKVKEIEEN